MRKSGICDENFSFPEKDRASVCGKVTKSNENIDTCSEKKYFHLQRTICCVQSNARVWGYTNEDETP